MTIPLVDKEDVVDPRNRERKVEKYDIKEKENAGRSYRLVTKKKSEKPVRILRIRYYEKISLSFMQDGKLEHRDAFAVNRGLEDLLKSLGYNTKIKGTITSHDCFIVERGDKMGVGNKFLFVDIGTNDFYTLKKQMENYTTVCAFNQGEFMILDGKRSSLTETFDIPKKLKEEHDHDVSVSVTNNLSIREILRNELKGLFRPYHLYEDEQIDRMKEPELKHLKRLANRKRDIENTNRKFYEDLLK
jgi:hypothetical protein